jgi:putative SOS response-associated peptidase YedK
MDRENGHLCSSDLHCRCSSTCLSRGTNANPVEGEHTLFGFLTCEPNDVVGAVHPKAMPVILTTDAEIDQWMTAPAEEALKLQRPLPNGILKIVASGQREDGEVVAA